MEMDIPLVLDRIRPGAAWRSAGSYEELKATWEDAEQEIPSLEEIESDWTAYERERAAMKYSDDREAAYNYNGLSIHELAVAMWERVVEGRPEDSDEIEKVRQRIKREFPKP